MQTAEHFHIPVWTRYSNDDMKNRTIIKVNKIPRMPFISR